LGQVAELARSGSEIVFQFIVPASTLAGEESSLVTALAARAAAVGEPWLSFFEPDEMEAHLREMGFGEVFHLDQQRPPKDICSVVRMTFVYRPTFT
jgi:O-methyltransferase involved in polyketide biosynthesis